MGPKQEDTGGLEQAEYAVWIRFLAAESALNPTSYKAQAKLLMLLDHAPSRGPWCEHESCEDGRGRALDNITRWLWKTPVTR